MVWFRKTTYGNCWLVVAAYLRRDVPQMAATPARDCLRDVLRQLVPSQSRYGMVGPKWCEDASYRACQPLGNRIQRSFRQQAKRRSLNVELFNNIMETIIVIKHWRRQYEMIRPHSSLRYSTPALQFIRPKLLMRLGSYSEINLL